MIASSVIDRNGIGEVIGFLNDVEPVGTLIGSKKKIKVIGTTDDLGNIMKDRDIFVFIAYVGLLNEKATYKKIVSLNIPQDRYYNIIDSSAIIPTDYCELVMAY
jgi:hypothetical protein